MERSKGYVSAISIWELGIKIKNRKLEIGLSIDLYTKKLSTLSYLEILPVDHHVWLKNLSLDWDHRDPADRTIVAQAKLGGLPIITSDEKIRGFYTKCIW